MDSTWQSKLSEPKLREISVLCSKSLPWAYAPLSGHTRTAMPSNKQDFNLCLPARRQTGRSQKIPVTEQSTLTILILSRSFGFCSSWCINMSNFGDQLWDDEKWRIISWLKCGGILPWPKMFSHAQKACRNFSVESYLSWRGWHNFEKKNLVLFWNLHGQCNFLTVTFISAFVLNNL